MSKKAIFTVEGVGHLGVKTRILAQYEKIAAVALSGIDKGRTLANISYPL